MPRKPEKSPRSAIPRPVKPRLAAPKKRAKRTGGSGTGKGGNTGKMVRYSLIVAAVWVVLAGGVLLSHWISQLPDTSNLLAYAPSQVITIVDSKGRTIARRGLVQGEFVRVGELPSYVSNAFIAIEDRPLPFAFRH